MSDEQAIRYCKTLIQRCKDDPTYETKCIDGEYVFYLPHEYGLMPGHIYSEIGMAEFKISQSCEYHFDKWTEEPD